MRRLLLAAGLLVPSMVAGLPAAHAQIVIQPPGVVVGPPPPRDDYYWRRQHEEEWRRRAEYEQEQRHEDWVRAHCVRDWRGEEFCRR